MFSNKIKILILIIIFCCLSIGIYFKDCTAILGSTLFLLYFLWIFKKWKNLKVKEHFNIRALAMNDVILFFLLILVLRLFNIQVLNNKKYTELVNNQIEGIFIEKGNRGNIYDITGKKLAYNINIYNIFIDPKRIIKNEEAIEAIKEILDRGIIDKNKKKFLKEIEEEGKAGRRYKIFAKAVNEKVNDEIKKIKIKYHLNKDEIFVKKESRRQYYKKDLYARVVGTVGFLGEQKDKSGVIGIEKKYDEYLKAKYRTRKTLFAKANKTILPTAKEEALLNLNGKNIYLTIDNSIQYILNDEVKKRYEATNSESAFAIMINPNNGKILATSVFSKNKKSLKNPLFQSQFEPGSIFKPIVVASALEDGYITKDSKFDVKDGKIEKYRHTIRESSKSTRGVLTLPEVLEKSSNVAMVMISDKFSDKVMEKGLRNFGFYDKTHIDYPYEIKPYIRKSKYWNGLTKNTIAFGQGIAVTPIQMAAAFSAIINGGKLYRPYLVEKIVDEDGIVIRRNLPFIVSKPISSLTSKKMREMLETVVEVGGGREAKIKGYRIGGKTGTAQISGGKKGYIKNNYLTSFIGFFPANKPEYLAVVMFYKPQVSSEIRYGGLVAAPVFKEIINRIIMEKNIQSDYIEEVNVNIKKEKKRYEQNLQIMPDLRGMSLRDINRMFSNSKLEVKPSGIGVVDKQVPEVGESLEDIKEIKVYLK